MDIHSKPGKAARVVLIGDICLGLYSEGYHRFSETNSFEVDYMGSEACVAVTLTRFGIETQLVTRFPQNALGDAAIAHLRRHGVGTNYIIRGGSRIGIYFIERGAEQRPATGIYDRIPSSVTEMEPSMFDWEKVFDNCSWFHFTGITPALSASAAGTVRAAAEYAKKRSIPISCDVNYRSKLWTRQEAARVLRPLVHGITCIFGNEADARDVFEIGPRSLDIESGSINADMYREVLTKVLDSYAIRMGAMTVRKSYSAFSNDWSGVYHDGKNLYMSQCYGIKHIINRFGAGDAFAGAMLYAILTNKQGQEAVDFAAAASCLKHSLPGALNVISLEEIEDLIKTGGTGRVKR
jgi:2-dehydro-3-deoxygluconokinase